MTCSQLGGACELTFSATTFDEIAKQSQDHGRDMLHAKDQAHMEAMNKMMEIVNAGQMEAWMSERKAEFDAL